jgi:hypothetical protein
MGTHNRYVYNQGLAVNEPCHCDLYYLELESRLLRTLIGDLDWKMPNKIRRRMTSGVVACSQH